jgi:hypothetical protein
MSQLMPIHFRHIDIRDEYLYSIVTAKLIESLRAATSTDHLATQLLEHFRNCFEYTGVVINNYPTSARHPH